MNLIINFILKRFDTSEKATVIATDEFIKLFIINYRHSHHCIIVNFLKI